MIFLVVLIVFYFASVHLLCCPTALLSDCPAAKMNMSNIEDRFVVLCLSDITNLEYQSIEFREERCIARIRDHLVGASTMPTLVRQIIKNKFDYEQHFMHFLLNTTIKAMDDMRAWLIAQGDKMYHWSDAERLMCSILYKEFNEKCEAITIECKKLNAMV